MNATAMRELTALAASNPCLKTRLVTTSEVYALLHQALVTLADEARKLGASEQVVDDLCEGAMAAQQTQQRALTVVRSAGGK